VRRLTCCAAIDSSGFYDPRTRTQYVVYKIDGNAKGRGGMCNKSAKSSQTPYIDSDH